MDAYPGSMHPDDRAADALAAFVRGAAGAGVSVVLADGIATLSGAVATPTARIALADLVRWHEGVRHVINRLEVRDAAPMHILPASE